MLVSESITKIRRLINDVEEDIFTDAQILTVFGRIQQDFCREVAVEQDIILLKAPPHIDYTVVHSFEEGYCSDGIFQMGFEGETQSSTQPWELETGYTQSSEGGYTITSGADIPHVDTLQQPVPFFMGDEVYVINALLWDNKIVEQRTTKRITDEYSDNYCKISDVVDYFDMHISSRHKAFYTRGIPETLQSSGTNQASQIDEDILSDVFYVFCQKVPARPSATTDTIDVYPPFVKYIEFGVAGRLYAADTEKYSELWSSHYTSRYEMGAKICAFALRRGYAMRTKGLSGGITQKPLGRPRFPDHYPVVEF